MAMTSKRISQRADIAVRNDVQRILHERAEVLARPVENGEVASGIQVVVLRLGSELYGVDTAHLNEVRAADGLTPVPNLPRLWSGLIAFHGTLYPVLDLRIFLGLTPDPDVVDPKVVVVSNAGLEIGLLVDDAIEVRRVSMGDMDPALMPETRTSGVRAITPDLLSILDLEAILTDPRVELPDHPSDKGDGA